MMFKENMNYIGLKVLFEILFSKFLKWEIF